MDFSSLVRNAPAVHAVLKELPSGKIVCTKQVKIYVPSRFLERNLAIVGVDNHILGIYAIVVDDTHYAVSLVNAMINIEPTYTNRVVVDDVEYLEFVFEPGNTVIKDTKLVKADSVVYLIYDEILSSGKIPWYMSYEDVGNIFNTASYHAGANIGQNREVTQMIASICARQKTNRRLYYRHAIKTNEEKAKHKPAWIALNAISYTATNAVSKLSGNFQAEGIIAAINHPTERTERIERILLK